MSNSYTKYLELKEQGAFKSDPNNVSQILYKASERGLKSQVFRVAMDLIRENPELSNDDAIILSAKELKI